VTVACDITARQYTICFINEMLEMKMESETKFV